MATRITHDIVLEVTVRTGSSVHTQELRCTSETLAAGFDGCMKGAIGVLRPGLVVMDEMRAARG